MPRFSQSLLKTEWTASEPAPASKLEVSLSTAAQFARRHAIAAIYRARIGDVGAALSCAELLACLYGAELNLWPSTVTDPTRDRFVLSNSDAAPTLNAIAAHYGFCDAGEALDFCRFGNCFGASSRDQAPGFVEWSAGSPGAGLSMAMGMALGLKLKKSSARVYALMSRTEAQAGEVWEAALCAARHALENLCVIVEMNHCAHDELGDVVAFPESMAAKWRAFEWAVAEVDGHDIAQILSVFRRSGTVKNRPTLIVAHTVRAKGAPALADVSASAPLALKQAAESLASLGVSHKEITELLDGA